MAIGLLAFKGGELTRVKAIPQDRIQIAKEARNATLLGVCTFLFGVIVAFGITAYIYLDGENFAQVREIGAIGLIGSILFGLFIGALHYMRATWGR